MQNSRNMRGDLKKGGGMVKSTSLTVKGRIAKDNVVSPFLAIVIPEHDIN